VTVTVFDFAPIRTMTLLPRGDRSRHGRRDAEELRCESGDERQGRAVGYTFVGDAALMHAFMG
jgi:hypothetical protein